MAHFSLNSSFLLRLSPYAVVGLLLLLAILIVIRHFKSGRRRSGCCSPGDRAGQIDKAGAPIASACQDIPMCGSCKGCKLQNCPGLAVNSRIRQNPGKDHV